MTYDYGYGRTYDTTKTYYQQTPSTATYQAAAQPYADAAAQPATKVSSAHAFFANLKLISTNKIFNKSFPTFRSLAIRRRSMLPGQPETTFHSNKLNQLWLPHHTMQTKRMHSKRPISKPIPKPMHNQNVCQTKCVVALELNF